MLSSWNISANAAICQMFSLSCRRVASLMHMRVIYLRQFAKFYVASGQAGFTASALGGSPSISEQSSSDLYVL